MIRNKYRLHWSRPLSSLSKFSTIGTGDQKSHPAIFEMAELVGGGIVGTMCSELDRINGSRFGVTDPQIEELNKKLKFSNQETDRLKKTLSEGVKLLANAPTIPSGTRRLNIQTNSPLWTSLPVERKKFQVKRL
ncbi:hypothetical protein DVH24_029646 [Malus domestica]|uniref:Uncharacterized protein n=1 Tax=Malus domestica TaxID=3750 RepID=A0A498HZ90_MALDO|nr:hypothetical protein DVH24_029646 [Malus domestica]